MSEHDPLGWIAVIAAMALTVYITRAGGFWLIGRFTLGPRLRKMLNALPGAIIAATIAPLMIHGGMSAFAAVTAALLAVVTVRNDFAAVVAGVGVAALVRAGGF